MSLQRKIFILVGIVIAVEILSFLFTIFSLKELAAVNEHISEDYQIHLQNRRMRSRIALYHDAGLLYWLRKDPRDFKDKEIHKEKIFELLKEGPPDWHASEVRAVWKDLEPRIAEFIIATESINEGSGYLTTDYMDRYRQLSDDLEKLVFTSSEKMEKEGARHKKFKQETVISSIAILSIGLISLLFGLFLFRRLIINPISCVIEVLDNMRRGDFSQRVHLSQNDEIGRMADTVNKMSDELVQIRKERVEFIGAVAHDLNNPLNVIALSCEMAQRKSSTLTAEEGLKTIQRIRQKVETLKRLTQDLLETAKENTPLLSLNFSTFRLNDLVKEVVEEYKDIKPDHAFVVEEKDLVEVSADRQRIYQVVQNLISNSVKYSPPGTQVIARLSKQQHKCLLEIIDEGSGIPDIKKETIFHAFSRLDSNKEMAEGTGLGLTIVRNIIAAHGGKISVHDNLPKGTIFRVILPHKEAL